MRAPILPAILLLAATPATAAEGLPWSSLVSKSDAWYRGDEASRLLDNILSNQADLGDWPKNFDTSKKRFDGDRSKLRGTFDNGATVGEIRVLARGFSVTGGGRYRDAAVRGLDHILNAQYPNGGWPQSFPAKGYARYITFNDNTMVNILGLLREVSRSDDFQFVGDSRRERAGRAFRTAIDCILRCQIKVDGRATVWCAQHDETTLEPRGARTFELPSLSGSESAGILMLLMSLEDPGPEVVRAVDAGVRWFDAASLTGIRQVVVDGDRKIIADPSAPPLWARFYEIDTGRPFFCGRDGIKKYSLADIEAERRNGYAWYGTWGEKVAKRHATWKTEHSETTPR